MNTYKVGIDARLLNQTGVGTYLQNLIYYLHKQDNPVLEYHLFIRPQDLSLTKSIAEDFHIHLSPFKWHSVKEQTNFLKVLYDQNLDLMHFTYFGYPFLYRRPFIATVHDLTPILFKTGKASAQNPFIYEFKHFVFQFVLRSQIMHASAIITPTQEVANQIKKMFHVKDGFIHPIYEGVGHALMGVKENELSHVFDDPFFIYVGNFYPHKNVERLIKGFLHVKNGYKLILVGPRDYFAIQIKAYIEKLGLTDKISMYHDASLSDLKFFYHHAQALIHPSRSEGFGLPLIEAAWFHCPIIASDIPVFKELLGENYVAFNATSIQNIADKINYFIEKKPSFSYPLDMQKYSFEHMACETQELYLQQLRSKHG